ncbi:MAG: hypothetical protein ACTSVO_02490 [Candidatus Heimdallarchaeaceae archaeon]
MIHASAKKKKSFASVEDLLIIEPIRKRILSFSTLAKIAILAVLAVIAYFLVTIIAGYENSIYFPILIILIITAFFFIWVTCLYLLFSITSTQLETKLIKKLFSLLLVMGVLSAYFAVVIENKSFVLVSIISGFFSSIGSFPEVYNIIHYIFYVFIIPIVEEVAKIFPIIILLGNYARLNLNAKRSIHTRLTPSFRIFVLLGGFFGAWFDLFEQFLSYSEKYSSSTPETIIDFIIFKRSIYPLHTVTTMIAAAGLGLVFIYRKKLPKYTRAAIGTLFLILSISYHSLWNYSTVFSSNEEARLLLYSILGNLSYVLFGIFILVIILYVPSFCPKCFTQHIAKSCPETSSQSPLSKEKLEKMKNTEPLYDEKTNLMVCSQCRTPVYTGEFCLNCWSFPKIQCRNCNQVLPSFARVCWSCGTEVDSLYEKMSSSSPPFFSTIAVGFTRILAAGMLISFIFTFATIDDTVSFLGYTLFLLSIIIAIFITVFWYRYKRNRVRSILSSINLLSIVAISIIVTSLYMITFSLLLIISIIQIIYGIIGMLCTLILVSASVYFLFKTTKGVRLIVL